MVEPAQDLAENPRSVMRKLLPIIPIIAILAAFLACSSVCCFAEDITAEGVAVNFSADGEVLELDVPHELDGVSFYIVWNTTAGQYRTTATAWAGRHCYELRNIPEWKGSIDVLAITLPDIPRRVKRPTFADEMDMFLAPERLTPALINSLVGHTLFAWPWTTVLMALIPFLALGFAVIRKKPLVQSFALAALASWVLADLRAAYDHAWVVYNLESNELGMFPLAAVQGFADRAADVIGDSAWRSEPLDGVYGNFLDYRLAEHPYLPAQDSKEPDFWITRNPGSERVVLEYLGYSLIRKTQP